MAGYMLSYISVEGESLDSMEMGVFLWSLIISRFLSQLVMWVHLWLEDKLSVDPIE